MHFAIPSLSRLELIDRYQNDVGKAACSKMLDEAGGSPLASTILRMCLYKRPKGDVGKERVSERHRPFSERLNGET